MEKERNGAEEAAEEFKEILEKVNEKEDKTVLTKRLLLEIEVLKRDKGEDLALLAQEKKLNDIPQEFLIEGILKTKVGEKTIYDYAAEGGSIKQIPKEELPKDYLPEEKSDKRN